MTNGNEARGTKITMDVGTAYDFLASLYVLHRPKRFGVRGAWASGMLARLTAESREALSKAKHLMGSPVHLVPLLPEPRNVETFLWHLAQWDPIERLEKLTTPPRYLRESGGSSVLRDVARRGRWTEADRRQLKESLHGSDPEKDVSDELLGTMLDVWADAEAFSNAYIAALRNYHEVFFHEEEKRILPAIEAAGERIAGLAKTLDLPDLIEEISAGLRFDDLPEAVEYILAPSYWVTPLLLRMRIDADRILFVFGARPANDSIVPGETVPDGLIRALKVLSDPTRLRILRLVAEKPMGAAELARSLRLRTPTVLHHIHGLRLSGLVQIRMPEADVKQRSLLSLRPQAVQEIVTMLNEFLHPAARPVEDEE